MCWLNFFNELMKVIKKSTTLSLSLKKLVALKSARDSKKFTFNQLSKAIEMPHSMLVKLVHSDPEKRVHNPRIDTLVKIVNFFKQDGFDISLDQLLENKERAEQTIPLYSMESNKKIGNLSIQLASEIPKAIAIVSNEYIRPMFKKGTIFIVDTDKQPDNDSLIAVKNRTKGEIKIVTLTIIEEKKIFIHYNDNYLPIRLTPVEDYEIIGIIAQVNINDK